MSLAIKRLVIYLVATFALTWGWWFAVVWPLALGDDWPAGLAVLAAGGASPLSGVQTTLAVAVGMLFPAVGAVVARLATREGFRGSSLVRPVELRRTWKYYVLGWFGPALLIVAGGAVYFLANPADFDPTASAWLSSQLAALEAAGQSAVTQSVALPQTGSTALLIAQLAGGVLVAPVLNFVACFGEEWGWRGYMLPKLLQGHSMSFALVVGGVIWGLWHAPVIVLGHNYGTGCAGWPWTGILAMCIFTTAIGALMAWLTLRSGSCLPATIAHGALNGFASAGLMFSVSGGSPFVGPAPTGILGGSALLVTAVLAAVALMRRERAGKPQFATGE